MAGLMTAPMVIIEMVVMGAMYADKPLNMIIIAGSGVALVAFFRFIRQQTLIGDAQFDSPPCWRDPHVPEDFPTRS